MIEVRRTMDFGNSSKITNLPDATDPQQPTTLSQLNSTAEEVKTINPIPSIGLEATTTQEAVEELQEEINTNRVPSNLSSRWNNAIQ